MDQTRRDPRVSRGQALGRTQSVTAPATWDTPPLHTMTARAQAIWGEANQLGYRRGYEDGYRAATADHWQLPSYSEAVANIIAVGSLGIDRRERARREAGK